MNRAISCCFEWELIVWSFVDESSSLRFMHVWCFFDEMIGDYWCVMKDLHVAMLDFQFWTCWNFSGNSWMKIFKIFIMFIATCTLPANFAMTFIRLPANFATCSSPLPADYACMCVRVCTKRPCFICVRLAIWISLQFDSPLHHYFKCLVLFSTSLHYFHMLASWFFHFFFIF